MQDVIIIGGSFAGLTAALQLGRASRDVTVIDAGTPRNWTSAAAHGVPGWDGTAPQDMLKQFRTDLDAYKSIKILEGAVVGVSGQKDSFTVEVTSDVSLQARRLLLAHGVRDTFPALPDVSDVWGKTLLYCPYCHGFEVRNRPLAVLANHAISGHQAELLRADWSDDVTLLTGVSGTFSEDQNHIRDCKHDPRTVVGFAQVDDGIQVSFAEGSATQFASIFAVPLVDLSGTPAEMLGCALADGPLGPFVRVGPIGQTSVPGVFAAGDCARSAHNVTSAIGDGANAGIGCHQSLVFPGLIQPLEAAA